MFGVIVGDFDFFGDGVATGDAGVARSKTRVVDLLTSAVAEGLASEPIVAVARLAWGAIATVFTGLARHIGALECPSLEAVFGSLLLSGGW